MLRNRKRVEAFLYGIPRIELAIENLKKAIEEIDYNLVTPPTIVATSFSESIHGNFPEDKMSNWAAKMDEMMTKRIHLAQQLQWRQYKIAHFNRIMELLTQENPHHYTIIAKKYLQKAKPDSVIYDMYLFVSKRTFYRMLQHCLEVFEECMPDEFDTNLTPKIPK